MDANAQLAQIYRVLTNDAHFDADEAADMVDNLMAEVVLNPTNAQAIIAGRVGEFGWDIEMLLFRDCCYIAWVEAVSAGMGNDGWANMVIGNIEHMQGPMIGKWQHLEQFCYGRNLATLEMVRRWTAQPETAVLA